ncbi:ANTAR domain-containing response regulator [Chelatococcus reniformis]|uniref:Two-component system response regulator n=1 Tax=Chelatococcus reniformis TaxID=1494448 RepID=A0A916XQH4_9HYPH|nr:ANTAR domain-containing protein [Chelatococcus reniformis]GGC92360.1 two-component system response regulator [Chelatococcus reniformis]
MNRPDPPDTTLTVAIVDDNLVRAAILEEGLHMAGIAQVSVLSGKTNLLRQLVALDPDVVIIDLEDPSRDVLEQMFQVSRVVARPVAMFVDRSDRAMIEAAVDAGVSAYIVDGLKRERVKPIVDMAISRFNAFSRLRGELEATRTELAERKVIDRAKGILMKNRGIGEEEAYALLRKTAMNQSRKLVEVARSLVTAASLLDGGEP